MFASLKFGQETLKSSTIQSSCQTRKKKSVSFVESVIHFASHSLSSVKNRHASRVKSSLRYITNATQQTKNIVKCNGHYRKPGKTFIVNSYPFWIIFRLFNKYTAWMSLKSCIFRKSGVPTRSLPCLTFFQWRDSQYFLKK